MFFFVCLKHEFQKENWKSTFENYIMYVLYSEKRIKVFWISEKFASQAVLLMIENKEVIEVISKSGWNIPKSHRNGTIKLLRWCKTDFEIVCKRWPKQYE